MIKYLMESVLLLAYLIAIPATAQEISFYSESLQEQRRATVTLPNGYVGSLGEYPTVYVLDGQWYGNLVDSTLREANRFVPLFPEFVVVSIDNSDRWRDFTPDTGQAKDKAMFGGPYLAEPFREYLEKELIPHIEQKFRVNQHRLAIGYSLGGGFLADTLHRRPELFSSYLLISPYLRWNDDAVLQGLDNLRTNISKADNRVMLVIGEDEDDDTRLPAKQFYQALQASPLAYFHDFAGENHTSMPNASMFRSLRTLYRGWFPDRATGMSMDAMQHLDYFRAQHKALMGDARLQPGVYQMHFDWFGGRDADVLKKLCAAYEADYQAKAEVCVTIDK